MWSGRMFGFVKLQLHPGVGNRPVITYAHRAEPGRLGCVVSIQKCVKSDVYPVAISQKVTKNLPVSFYSPMPEFKLII